MITRIDLTNFKCFRMLKLTCTNLNLLCGLNGMGKSSVIQALLILRQSVETRDLFAGQLLLGGERVDIGTGVDVFFEDAEGDVVGFGLESDKVLEPWKMSFAYSRASNQLLAVNYDDEINHDSAYQDTYRNDNNNTHSVGSHVDRSQFRKPEMSSSSDRLMSESYTDSFSQRDVEKSFEESRVGRRRPPNDGYVPKEWRDIVPFGGHVVYVNAERIGPRKSYPLSDALGKRGEFGVSGEYAWNYLSRNQAKLFERDDPRCMADDVLRGRRLIDVVDYWMQHVCPGAHLQFEGVPDADVIIAGFSFDRSGDVATRRYRATNVGFGLSYVLPVILALLSQSGSLCLIENPEAHLHPRGQTKLAELAARAASAGVQVFAETHSDHFMDGVRIAVRDGIIAPKEASFHYFEREGNKAVVSSPRIDADGRLSHWPFGFFDQHEDNLARLLVPRP